MGKRRRNLFVLLFVLGLVLLSGLVIASKPTRLGLDLKGGVELVYQATPTGQTKEVSGSDIDTSIDIIRERIDQLGVSEPEVSRLGTTEISVSLPDVTNAERAIDQVGTTGPALLLRLGAEPDRPREGDRRPPGPRTAAGGAQRSRSGMERRRPAAEKAAQPAADLRRRLPDRLRRGEARLRTGTGPGLHEVLDDETALLPLQGKQVPRPDRRPGEQGRRPLHRRPSGANAPTRAKWSRSRSGTVVVSEKQQNSEGQPLENAEPGWFALNDEPALSGTEITNPKQETDEFGQPTVTFNFTDSGREAFHDVTRAIAQRGQEQAIGLPGQEEAEALSGHFAVVLDNEVKTRPIINFAENPDGIDGRTGAQISGGFQSIQEAQDIATFLEIGALPVDLKLISQTQVSATLGTPGAPRRDQGRRHRPDPGRDLPAALLPGPGRDRGHGDRRLRGDLLRPDQTDPDHPDAAGDRGPGADDRGHGRLEHRHLRANKRGGPGREIDVRRDLRPATNAGSRRSSTRTSSPC